jgi:hypothetical protein
MRLRNILLLPLLLLLPHALARTVYPWQQTMTGAPHHSLTPPPLTQLINPSPQPLTPSYCKP